MNKLSAFLLAATTLFAAGCGGQKSSKLTIQKTPFTGMDYSLTFPSDWQVSTNGMMGMDMIAMSPQESLDDPFSENVNVALENLPDDFNDQDYLDQSLMSLRKTFGVQEDYQFSKVAIGAENGYHLNYQMSIGERSLDNDVYVVIHKQAVYIITCSQMPETRADWKPVMDEIISSFKLIK
jgi:hypothetical protein